jgi:uncharacterized protein (TIGR00369 family)
VSEANSKLVDRMNAHRSAIIETLGGCVREADPSAGICVMDYDIDERLCHSTNIVQGGIITAMLDAAMTHATFAQQRDVIGLASLEVKVSFLEPSLAGRFSCYGKVRRCGYKVAFLEGELYNAEGKLTATASTTARLNRKPS